MDFTVLSTRIPGKQTLERKVRPGQGLLITVERGLADCTMTSYGCRSKRARSCSSRTLRVNQLMLIPGGFVAEIHNPSDSDLIITEEPNGFH